VIQPLNIADSWVVWEYCSSAAAIMSIVSIPTIRVRAIQNFGSLRMRVFSWLLGFEGGLILVSAHPASPFNLLLELNENIGLKSCHLLRQQCVIKND
jgi:hypothetical protein